MRKKMFHKYHSSWIILLSWNAVVVVWLLSLEAVVVAANGSKSPQPLTPSDPHHYSRSSFGAIPSLGAGSLVVDHHNIRPPIDHDPRIQAAATSGDDHDHDVVVDVDDDGEDGATAAAVVLIPATASTSTITTSKQKRSQPSVTQTIQQPKQREQQSDPITFGNMGTFPSIESLLADENFTNFLENFSTGNPSLLPSDYPSGSSSSPSLFNSQYFLPSSSNSPTGSIYPVDLNNLLPPSSASNQYYYNGQQHSYNYHPNNNNNNGNGNNNNNSNNNNKTSSGLGRRIGELVSNSAERATRALKSFPKLLNDIKPSKLWGWSSVVDTTDLTPKHNISSIPFHSISSAWYSPQNTWSSFAPPPITSSVYFQQPVFVRTHDANPTMQSPSPMQTNQILSPSTSSSSSPSSLLSPSSSVSTSAGNGNRFLSQQNVYPNTNDLYASAQTVYGNRVKPPTTVHQFGEYDNGSNEDINSIGSGSGTDSDDTKMANEGQLTDHMEEQGRINTVIMPQDHNGVPASNNDPNNNNNNNNNGGVWPQRQPPSSTYEDYGGEPGNQQDYYNHQSANGNGNGNNGQTNGFQNSVRFPASNRRPNPMTTSSSQAYRRPYNNWDMDDLESWYPTSFFGASANTLKPMASRFRTTGGFNTPSSSFTTNSLLAAASTTPTATSVAADYLPFISTTAGMFPRQSDQIQAATSPASYYPIAAAPVGPRWPSFTGFYPGFNPFLNHNGIGAGYYGYRPLATAHSMMRPVSVMPFYPQMNNHYYRPSYRPASPFVGSASTLYGSYALNPFLNTPASLVNPYHRPTFTSAPQVSPFNSLVAAASSLYPVRVPFPAIQPSPLSYNTIIPAPITSMPILRHRIGTIKSKRSQQPSEWKRNDLMTGTGSEHSPKYSKKPESTKSPSAAAAAALSLTENRNPKQQQQQSKQQRSNDQSNDDQQLASIYKTIQMFQSTKPSSLSSSVVMGEDEQINENNHRPVFSFLNQPPSEYRYYLNNHTQHYDHNKNHFAAESTTTTKTTTTPSSSSSSSQSASINQMMEDGGGQSPSLSSSAADTTTTTTTTNSSTSSFRLMRAHRHIGQQKQVEQTNKPKQQPQDNKIPRKTINPKWSDPIGSNEWKPLFRSLWRPTTTSSSSSTKLDH